MYQCVDCGSQNPQHICPKHPTFTVKEPGVVVTPGDPAALAEENALLKLEIVELRKTLERIVAMDAVTAAEREHYWTDRAERMRDLAMMALGGEPVPPLSQRLESADRWLDRYRKALQYIAEGGKLSPMEVARNALPKKCACGGYGKVVGGDGNFYTCPDCGGAGHAHEPTEKNERVAKAEAVNLQNREVIEGAGLLLEEAWKVIEAVYTIEAIRRPVKEALKRLLAAKETVTEKPKSEWAICGWCAGTGKEYGEECPKCQGAGGKSLEGK